MRAENDLDGDYHEFSITPDDTALITAYTKVPWDLTSRGRENGFIWDCVFQELDVTTNRLLFEWRASEHLNFEDMAVDSWTDWTGTEDDPWDWFHLNSVEKDVQGNYLISARYTNAITYISGQGGDVLWNLGGKNGDFTDLAEGNATHIVDPHMARWADNGTAITFFDNIAFWSYEKDKQQTHAIKIALNLETHVAKSLAEFVHPKGIFAESEGSIQHLDSGNYLVGYGSAPVYTEFSAHGEFLCDTHYAPLQAEKATLMGLPRHAYRTYKHHWVGFPEEPPKVKLEGQQLFVSWNGATEVRSWKLDGRKLPRNSWSSLGTYAKDDFEVAMKLQKSKFPDYRITAIDGHGSPLGAWFVHKDGRLTVRPLALTYLIACGTLTNATGVVQGLDTAASPQLA